MDIKHKKKWYKVIDKDKRIIYMFTGSLKKIKKL